MIRWSDHTDADAMANAVEAGLRDVIEAAVGSRGVAVLALAGGSTPWPAYERLAKRDLAWDRVILIPSDDRLVGFADPLSNVAAMTRIFAPRGARIESLVPAEPTDHIAAGHDADSRLRELPWPLDLVLLGIGRDGHTASIFPGPDYAAAAEPHGAARALGVMPDPLPPEAPVARVSLSLSAIAAARRVAIVATGSAKRAVLDQAIADGRDSPLPIGRVLAAIETPVQIYWAPQ